MNIWKTLTSNYVLNVTVLSWMTAQILKTILTLISTGKLEVERLVGAGGMPSAHSAATCALAIAVERKLGWDSPEFAIALAFAAIVMYDAMGVRRAAGEHAKVLNKMVFELSNTPLFRGKGEGEKPVGEDGKPVPEKSLKEYLGHTPFEVLGGVLLGILISLFVPVT